MQWWNDFVDWFNSDDGSRVITTAVVPFVAIIVAGVIGGIIGRSSTKRLLAYQDRELQSAAVAAVIAVGDRASLWSNLSSGEKDHLDAQMSAADIRLRLLPLTGASAAADWASHELAEMQRNSASFSFQAEQSFIDYRDRLLEWQRRPSRARKLFAADLERFRFESNAAESDLVENQRKWAAEQLAEATREAPAIEADVEPEREPEREAYVPIAVPASVAAAQADAEPIAPAPIVGERTLPEAAPVEADAVGPAYGEHTADDDDAPLAQTAVYEPITTIDEPVVSEPAADEPTPEPLHETVVVEPVQDNAEEPVTVEPTFEEATIDEPADEKPVENEPADEKPADAPKFYEVQQPTAFVPRRRVQAPATNNLVDPNETQPYTGPYPTSNS